MRIVFILPFAALAGCTTPAFQEFFGVVPEASIVAPIPAVGVAPPPPENATTVADFDTTSQADRDAAVSAIAVVQTRLGTTIASLGSPTEPGIWLKTPLVTTLAAGRVEYQGNAINIELRPSGGAAGSGSQISLAAMRLLEAPLTGLPELTVFAAP
ncbi:D-galactarate dehydratase [Yoonia sp.]|uniref:D-galactarate dehydratase n=1 Tax=Yoonia sp. TaxID=2212373 RepID=UPI0025D4BAEA|nr:D-galactarate dehydratase [Yoonia sp.]